MPSIVIPAHNEEAVLARTLGALVETMQPDEFEVVVVANGCSDNTIDIASAFKPQVQVIALDEASKTAALNVGDDACRTFPRVYLDADVVFTTESLRRLLHVLEQDRVLAAEPVPTIDTSNSAVGVRVWYRVWLDLYLDTPGKLGSGVFALTEKGRSRFGRFPDVTADDSFVRAQFDLHELVHVTGSSSVVTAPGSIRDLVKIKTRSRRGSSELADRFPDLWQIHMQRRPAATSLASLSPNLWPFAPWYIAITLLCKVRAHRQYAAGDRGWERDDSGRSHG